MDEKNIREGVMMSTWVQRICRLIQSHWEQYDELHSANSIEEIASWTAHHAFLGFNGQKVKAAVIRRLAEVHKTMAFVETGTYHGATAICAYRYLCLRVYSCEVSFKNFIISRLLTAGMKDVRISWSSSPAFLRSLISRNLASERPVFYLDAHRGTRGKEYLPLLDEISIIAELDQFVVIIDDFRVPWEDSFGYDVYDDVVLDINFVQDTLRDKNINKVYFPNYSPEIDSGFCRGYCVFWRSGKLDATHGKGDFPLNLLSPYELAATPELKT